MRTIAALFLLAGAVAAQGETLTLVENGRSRYAIAPAAGASAAELLAARELRRYLMRISGAELPLVSPGAPLDGPAILVGDGPRARALGVEIAAENLGPEGYVIRTAGANLVIAGGRPRGTLYGVYSFLEDQLGCRWFTPECERVPAHPTIRLDHLERRYVPPLEYRATDYPGSRDGAWCARNKMNGHLARCDEERGGHISYHHFVHTFNAILDPAKYFDTHPEYFSLIDGRRRRHPTQLCLSNPEVLRLATQVVRGWMKEAPGATIFSVSQNDWHSYCQCPRCAAIARAEGSQSGPILRFVNAIGAALERDFPAKALSTLAYQYSRRPPRRTRPRANVIVRLCTIECCFAHPLESDPFNAAFKRDIEGWSKISKRLYIWNYAIDYAHSIMPFPNLHTIAPNIRFFVEHGVRGIYEEANYFSPGGELAELRTYLIAKTLWDPSYDTHKAISEFLAGYYGPAAPHLQRYIENLHRSARAGGEHWRIYDPPSKTHFPAAWIATSRRIFDAAQQAVAKLPLLARRVALARLPLMYVQIMQRTPGSDLVALIERFETIARREGITRVREGRGGSLAEWLAAVRKGIKHSL